MGASAFLLYKLALQLFDAAVAWIAVTFFVLLHPVAHAAADARPYALGLLAIDDGNSVADSLDGLQTMGVTR